MRHNRKNKKVEKTVNEIVNEVINYTDDEYVKLTNVYKTYPNGITAVHDFNLNIKKHEFIVLVGPSGCGKSTTLRMIAGLEEISSGHLYINGVHSNNLSPKERNIALVFQSYALYPHMNVYNNIAFGLKMRKFPKDEIDRRVKAASKMLGLEDYLLRKPGELSGGQRQRVALGRAIVRDASVFLMDEPLSNLDAKLRVEMRSEIVHLHKQMDSTTIYVTHDQTEAMTMADRIVVMKDGYIQQVGEPKEIYDNPYNKFVAEFIGSPSTNIMKCIYDKGVIHFGNDITLDLGEEFIKLHDEFYQNLEVNLDDELVELIKKKEELLSKKKKDEKELLKVTKRLEELESKKECLILVKSQSPHPIYFGIRPEDIHHHVDANKAYKKSKDFSPLINLSELLGNEFFIHLKLGNVKMIAKVPYLERMYKAGEEFKVHFNLEKIHIFDYISEKKIY